MAKKMTGTFCERTEMPRSRFDDRSLRWVKRGQNWILIGCPKGKWAARAERCRVGTKAHKVLVKTKKGSRCKRGETRIRK
jgi:hypothetical protein